MHVGAPWDLPRWSRAQTRSVVCVNPRGLSFLNLLLARTDADCGVWLPGGRGRRERAQEAGAGGGLQVRCLTAQTLIQPTPRTQRVHPLRWTQCLDAATV